MQCLPAARLAAAPTNRWFLDEAADGGFGKEEIDSVCAHLAGTGFLREVVEGRWYALANCPVGEETAR